MSDRECDQSTFVGVHVWEDRDDGIFCHFCGKRADGETQARTVALIEYNKATNSVARNIRRDSDAFKQISKRSRK